MLYLVLEQLCLTRLVQSVRSSPVSLARGRHLHWSSSLFPSVTLDANMLFDLLLFFSYLFPSTLVFLLVLSPSVFDLFFQGFSHKVFIYSLSISLTFFLPCTFCTFTSTLFCIISPHLSALVSLSFHLLCSVLSLISSLFSFTLTHQGPGRGGEKRIYSVAAAGGKTAVLWFYLWICIFLTLCTSHTGAEEEIKSTLMWTAASTPSGAAHLQGGRQLWMNV